VENVQYRGSVTVTLLLEWCHAVVTLLLHCIYTVFTLLLHYCYTVVTLLLECCHAVVTLLLHCIYNVFTLLLHCCYLLPAVCCLLSVPFSPCPLLLALLCRMLSLQRWRSTCFTPWMVSRSYGASYRCKSTPL
jgi:hypothetical protein